MTALTYFDANAVSEHLAFSSSLDEVQIQDDAIIKRQEQIEDLEFRLDWIDLNWDDEGDMDVHAISSELEAIRAEALNLELEQNHIDAIDERINDLQPHIDALTELHSANA